MITDACGFLLLLPPVRGLLGRLLSGWAAKRVKVSVGGGIPGAGFPGAGFPGAGEGPQHHPLGDDVIDVTPNYSGPAREAPPPGLTLDVTPGQPPSEAE